jgi:hypothetical protein
MIKKWFKHYILKESLKEIELNKILDRISDGEILSKREDDFLDLYNQTVDSDYMDYSYLSRNLVCNKISDYIDKKRKVYCDLCDKNGKLSDIIVKVDKEEFKLTLRHGVFVLEDRFLYNITYNMKKDEYSLTSQDEYFEELFV